jgi:translation initiation factor 5B
MRSTKTEEASGITQQIGTTLYSRSRLNQLVGSKLKSKVNIDALLMIDTPGHDCFDTIRYVALMVSDIVILMIDMIKGIETQTALIISLIKKLNVPFIICLNKMDKIYGWTKPDPTDELNLRNVIKRMNQQQIHNRYMEYIQKVKDSLYEYEVVSELYYQNQYPNEYINIVPISAETGEGIPDLIMLINSFVGKRIMNHTDDKINSNLSYGHILDTHYDKHHGRYLIAIHRNGEINRSDIIIINDQEYSIKTLFVISDNQEMKDEHRFTRVDSITTPMGFGMILSNVLDDIDIEPASMYFLAKDRSNSIITKSIQKNRIEECTDRWNTYLCNKGEAGIQVIASSYVMMDALLHMLKSRENCKISRYKIGRMNKIDIIIASSWMDRIYDPIEKIEKQKHSIVLLYDPTCMSIVMSNTDIYNEYDIEVNSGTTIIQSNVIYKLIEMYETHICKINKMIDTLVVKPIATIQIIPKYIFRTSNPMIFGIKVVDGEIKPNQKVYLDKQLSNCLGKIVSMELNRNNVISAKIGDEVCIKIETTKVIGHDIDKDSIMWIIN